MSNKTKITKFKPQIAFRRETFKFENATPFYKKETDSLSTLNSPLCKTVGTLCAQITRHIVLVFHYKGDIWSLFYAPVHPFIRSSFGFHSITFKFPIWNLYTRSRTIKGSILTLSLFPFWSYAPFYIMFYWRILPFFPNSRCNTENLNNKQDFFV